MSVSVRVLAALAVCGCLAVSAADKVVMTLDSKVTPVSVSGGRVWRINDSTVKATLPARLRFPVPIQLVPGKTYTLSAEVRSTGGAVVGGSSTKSYGWIGFIQDTKDASRASIRVSKDFAEVISDVPGGDMKIVVKGNLESWDRFDEVALYAAVNAKADGSDLPNNNLIRMRAGRVKKLSKDKWEIMFDRPLQQALPAGTKLAIHFDCKLYDFVAASTIGTNWVKLQGAGYMNGKKAETAFVAFACNEDNGEIEIRNLSVVESSK